MAATEWTCCSASRLPSHLAPHQVTEPLPGFCPSKLNDQRLFSGPGANWLFTIQSPFSCDDNTAELPYSFLSNKQEHIQIVNL